jgi:hypothetical protein
MKELTEHQAIYRIEALNMIRRQDNSAWAIWFVAECFGGIIWQRANGNIRWVASFHTAETLYRAVTEVEALDQQRLEEETKGKHETTKGGKPR